VRYWPEFWQGASVLSAPPSNQTPQDSDGAVRTPHPTNIRGQEVRLATSKVVA